MDVPKIIVTWHEGKDCWVASTSPPAARAAAPSPKIAVSRVQRALALTFGARAAKRAQVRVELPAEAVPAFSTYREIAERAAAHHHKLMDEQLELGRMLISKYRLNRSQAAAMVGINDSYLGRLMDGKTSRESEILEPPAPDEALARHIQKSK